MDTSGWDFIKKIYKRVGYRNFFSQIIVNEKKSKEIYFYYFISSWIFFLRVMEFLG